MIVVEPIKINQNLGLDNQKAHLNSSNISSCNITESNIITNGNHLTGHVNSQNNEDDID